MRHHILILLLFLSNWGSSQQKGATPVQTPEMPASATTRAVVIGISDYQHPQIPDLRFAHRDAEAFDRFLQSPAGGNLPSGHIKLLLNEQATYGQMVAALDWLLEATREGENAIIFFSGHGDVETRSRNQLGFLLTWDTPAQAYKAGAYPLIYLQDIVQTLSLDRKAKVLVIADACRSGNLAGNQIGGTLLTNANLAQQFANEIKILSCQPNQYSIEGEKWGNGRGVFSYYLTQGLSGNAEGNHDGIITLMELERYLEDFVPVQAAPHQQLPMFSGNKLGKLAVVQKTVLVSNEPVDDATKIPPSPPSAENPEGQSLAKASEASRENYRLFFKAVKEHTFFQPPQACADYYYELLAADPVFAPLLSDIQRAYAAALQDEAQQALNALIESDPYEVNRFFFHPERYLHYPDFLQRSIELLGENHYSVKSLRSKKNFFKAINFARTLSEPDKIDKEDRVKLHLSAHALLDEAIQLEPTAAYLYYGKCFLYSFQSPSKIDSVLKYCNKALDQAPTWLLPRLNIASEYLYILGNYARAEAWLLEAKAVNPQSYIVAERLNWLYLMFDRPEEAQILAEKMLELRPDLFNSYGNMGGFYFLTKDYPQAEKWYLKSLEIDNTPVSWVHQYLIYIYLATRRHGLAQSHFDQLMNNEKTPYWVKGRLYLWYGKGLVNFTTQWQTAETCLTESTDRLILSHEKAEGLLWLAKSKMLQKQTNAARELLEKLIALDSTVASLSLAYALKGELLSQSNNSSEAEQWLKKGAGFSSGIYSNDMYFREEAMFRYGAWLLRRSRYAEAENQFRTCILYSHANGFYGYLGLAMLAARQGNAPQTLQNIEQALEKWLPLPQMLLDEPIFGEIKKEPQFDRLLKKHFPGYSND
jgi:tetratricopeptide (TPR) repeat protein